MKVRRFVFGLVLAAAVGVGVAQASTTSFDASLTNITPPDEVGFKVFLKLDGKITTPSHSKVVKQCRVARTVAISWARPDGTRTHGNATYPSRKNGHFGAELDLDYGNDVPEAGGPFKVFISTKSVFVPGKRLGEDYKCKKLKETLQIDVPPAKTD